MERVVLKLPWKAKPRVPCERASKTMLETGVKCDPAFCLGSSIEKTISGRNRIVSHDVALPSISLDRIGCIAGTMVKKMVA